MYVNSNPLYYPTCIWRTTGTPGPLWRHMACYMLPALSAPGHSKPIRLQGCDSSLFFFFLNFSFFKLTYFSWRIITLQYRMIFAIYQHESATGIHASPHPEPPSPPYASEISQSTSFGCPASCIKFVLVVGFTCANVHVSTIFSL